MSTADPDSILLYRYLDAVSALKTIETQSFKVGRIHDFNDHFEWRVGLDPEKFILGCESSIRAIAQDGIDVIDGWLGILCHSAAITEPVLWSHYADKHRGVAFEISHTRDPQRLVKIEYDKDRPVLDPARVTDRTYIAEIISALIRQKSRGWEYEQEYRVYVQLKDCEISGGHYFQKIPDKLLKRVILGYDCPLEEDYVRKALDAHGLSSVKVVRARMCLKTYSIQVD